MDLPSVCRLPSIHISVFHYEILNNPEEACKMARQAFEDAIAELDNVRYASRYLPAASPLHNDAT